MMASIPPTVELRDGVREYLIQSVSQGKDTDTEAEDKITSVLESLSSPPMYTTIRLNTLNCDLDEGRETVQKLLTQQYQERGWSEPEVFNHPDIPELLVVPSNKDNTLQCLPLEVIVDVACGMAVLRGADVFAQGIMAAPPILSTGDLVSVHADLDGGCRRGYTKQYTGRKRFVGNGVAMVTREQLFCGQEKLSGVGIRMTCPPYQAPGLDQLPGDLLYAQNLPSVVCSRVLAPQPGDTVLDMCAAPGGKTTHIGNLMKNKGRLVAFDKSKNKIGRIRDNCGRCGVEISEVYHYDGTRSVDNTAAPEGPPPYPPATFDLVLLDAPCSALGQRPAIQNKAKLVEIASYPPLQKKLFSQAVRLLRAGGHLVYSTCTIPVEENEALVVWALREHHDIQLVKQTPSVGGPGWPCPGLTDDQRLLLQRFDPSRKNVDESQHQEAPTSDKSSSSVDDSHINWADVNRDTIGFFIAKFQKVVDGEG